jgi:hypothetical protein
MKVRLVHIRRPWGRWLVAALMLSSAACSILLTRDAFQCQTDADCTRFGGHPYCIGGFCTSSGLGPPACVYFGPGQAPVQPSDFLNQCGTAQCAPFDDCARLGVCGDGGPPLVSPPDGHPTAPAPSWTPGTLPSCLDSDAGRGNVVFMSGASTWPPLIAKLAPLVIDGGGPTPVFQTTSSCAAVQAVFESSPMVDPAAGAPMSSYAVYFAADGTQVPCLIGSGGAAVDIGASDIFASSCGFEADSGTTPTNDTTGAIQAIAFIVPSVSPQLSISAEAAREVFGTGGHDGGTTPWVDPSRYFVRNAGTGSQQMVGRAIGVPPAEFWGVDQGTATNLVNAIKVLTMAPLAEPAIGFVSVNTFDANRGNVAALAFKDWGQDCAYLPDSTPLSTDKQNVRDGHYPIWGPIHFLTSFPPSAAATQFLTLVAVPEAPAEVIDAFIDSSLVPTCAMNVQRETELGPLATYSPPVHCGCYFDSKRGDPSAMASCTPCTDSTSCPASRPACRLGYCEIR